MAKKNASRAESPATGAESIAPSTSKEEVISALAENAENDQELALGATIVEDVPQGSDNAEEQSKVPADDTTSLVATNATGADVVDQPNLNKPELKVSTPIEDEISTLSATAQQGNHDPTSERPSNDIQRKSEDISPRLSTDQVTKSSEVQVEINSYIERIDALHSKLQYLSKEAANSARQAAIAAESGTVEKKLSEKDEKIALLLEEGQRLSKSEMTHLAIIKKLRGKSVADVKEQESIKARADKAEGALRRMEDRARKAEAANKQAEQTLAARSTSTQDLEAVRKERDALHATIADMRSQLQKANSRAVAAENKAQSEQLEKERKRAMDLQDDLTSAKVEREISEEKLHRDIKDLKATLGREKEQARAMESEMLNEQATLESKLESFRVRAEEASSADYGNVQAKLLRQIETLQTQYATASQNWQGIESTLIGRITSLEKERDEVVVRETELRKKLRDSILKAKNGERELDAVQNKYMEMEKSVADNEAQIQRLSRKTTQLETDLATARNELEDQRVSAERDLQGKLDEEKARWTAALHIQRNESPGTSIRKNNSNIGLDLNHLMSPVQYERGNSRKPSMMYGFDSSTPPRQQSLASPRGVTNGSVAETSAGVTSMEAEDYFANVPQTPLSTSHYSHRGINDLISNSTVGAGPSVQLVERMSANVRRLESEKAASKDELTRILGQRDEARQEVVNLMREVEEKRKIEERLTTIEKQHQDLSQKHRTTLEILGEKSEQVEELKADVVDVKQMYRQLADTMK